MGGCNSPLDPPKGGIIRNNCVILKNGSLEREGKYFGWYFQGTELRWR